MVYVVIRHSMNYNGESYCVAVYKDVDKAKNHKEPVYTLGSDAHWLEIIEFEVD